ncbi:hypothetical protein CLOLEP_00617 [[Clostridium] leptum DSM 753]|uniref:Uncharacterized protein n=1 Tax=[Clostridium] leptum DSM 753 TaxID=428125 RepID=A7VPZ0_9FIRM|nr:hypothetical protein CLOLEP_00617 [[Clostridium] leptum DSM 753]
MTGASPIAVNRTACLRGRRLFLLFIRFAARPVRRKEYDLGDGEWMKA